MKKIYIFALLISTGAILILSASDFQDENGKVIKFSHKQHFESIDCQSCHTKVTESKNLSDRLLPEKEVCAGCHDVESETECELCHFTDVYEPLVQSKSSLIFDHSLHMNGQDMKCADCHKGFEEADYSFQAYQPNPLMQDCGSCHNSRKTASNACESCHISTADLIPADHRLASFPSNHKFTAATEEENCIMCHDDNFCESCHISTTAITEKNTSLDFYRPYSPRTYVDNAKQQQITLVHDINYVYTHGIDLKGKTSECQTCHQTETFCAECHNSGTQDFGLEGFVPASHRSTNFFTFGRGSGGGDHAVLAKRDIERCASCHDTNGGDPVCITCHMDSDGIKGTDPKTHETDFMLDENGDWHSAQGSICYNCHTGSPSSPIGSGFCRYCHGGN